MASDLTQLDSYFGDDRSPLFDARYIRFRPGAFFGPTDARGLHSIIFELVADGLAEWEEGTCNRIAVELLRDGGCRVHDDGRGIPLDFIASLGMRHAQVVMTRLGYLARKAGIATSVHGVSPCVINAVSASLHLRIARAGVIWEQEYRQGEPVTPLQPVGDAAESGTSITF